MLSDIKHIILANMNVKLTTCHSCDWLTDGEFQVLQDEQELPELRAVPAFQAFQGLPDQPVQLDIVVRKVRADRQAEEVYKDRQVLQARQVCNVKVFSRWSVPI